MLYYICAVCLLTYFTYIGVHTISRKSICIKYIIHNISASIPRHKLVSQHLLDAFAFTIIILLWHVISIIFSIDAIFFRFNTIALRQPMTTTLCTHCRYLYNVWYIYIIYIVAVGTSIAHHIIYLPIYLYIYYMRKFRPWHWCIVQTGACQLSRARR